MLRYIWVYSSGANLSNNNGALNTTKLSFNKAYYDRVGLIKDELKLEKTERLRKAHERAQKRHEEELIMKEKLENQLKEQEQEEESKKYDEKLEKLEKKFVGKGSQGATKRIMKEYKHFQTSADIENFEINFKGGDNLYQWNVILDILKFELTPDLKKDFEWKKAQENKDPTLEFEITFPSDYPFKPPFIRVVRPIFQFHTGHVTIGGSMCMESLTNQGWLSTRSVEGLFVEILSIILQGGARLDRARLGHCYSHQEARSAFERVAKDHGWM